MGLWCFANDVTAISTRIASEKATEAHKGAAGMSTPAATLSAPLLLILHAMAKRMVQGLPSQAGQLKEPHHNGLVGCV